MSVKLTTTTPVSVDGVVQGNGGPGKNRTGGLERGGWARPLFDSGAMTFVDHVYLRADAFLFGGRIYDLSIHLAPVLFGAGTRMFDDSRGYVQLEAVDVVPQPAAIHRGTGLSDSGDS